MLKVQRISGFQHQFSFLSTVENFDIPLKFKNSFLDLTSNIMDLNRRDILFRFLFMILMLFKLSALHIYESHNDNSAHCESCEFTIQSAFANAIPVGETTLTETPLETIAPTQKAISRFIFFSPFYLQGKYYNKPPPQLA